MLGVVNLDKPVGPTSHDMVGLLRRLSGTRRVGHAGTLDPLASGVLPILLGGATRLSEELSGGLKRYRATIRLGERSLTDDAQGPLSTGAVPPSDAAVLERALDAFRGTFSQRPPAFSARKQEGRTAHRSARAGEPLELPARSVTVHALDVVTVLPGERTTDVVLDIRCEAGTYVRSIARDLGELLGCGGHLAALRRTEAAGLSVDDALTPAELERLAGDGRLAGALVEPGSLLSLPRVELDAETVARFTTGGTVPLSGAPAPDGRHAVYGDGRLLGIGTAEGGALRPLKVLATEGGR